MVRSRDGEQHRQSGINERRSPCFYFTFVEILWGGIPSFGQDVLCVCVWSLDAHAMSVVQCRTKKSKLATCCCYRVSSSSNRHDGSHNTMPPKCRDSCACANTHILSCSSIFHLEREREIRYGRRRSWRQINKQTFSRLR